MSSSRRISRDVATSPGSNHDDHVHEHLRVSPDDLRREEGGISTTSSATSTSTLAYALTPRQYKALVSSHWLALLPALLLLGLLLLLAVHSPCHLHALPLLTKTGYNDASSQSLNIPLPSPEDSSRLSSQRCFTILHSGLTYSALILASVSWLASHSASHFALDMSTLVFTIFGGIQELCYSMTSVTAGSGDQTSSIENPETNVEELEQPQLDQNSPIASTLISIIAIFIKTSILECLRLGSLISSFALVRAQIPRLHGHDQNGPGSLPPPGQDHHNESWMEDLDHRLQPTDIRFKLALWCSLGWAATEVCFGAYQLFQQLSLYSPASIISVEEEADGFPDETDVTAQHEPKSLQRQSGNSRLDIPCTEQESHQILDPLFSTRVPHYGSPSDRPSNGQMKSPLSPSNSSRSSMADAAPQSADEEDSEESQSSVSSESLTPILTHLDSRVQSLLLLHKRSELESQLGTSLTAVPVTLCGLWRIDSLIWNLALTMLAGASVVFDLGPIWSGGRGRPHRRHHSDSIDISSSLHPHLHQPPIFPSFNSQVPILVFLISIHTILTAGWRLMLPTLGFGILTYSSLLIGIGLLVAAGGWWQVVV